MHDAHWAAAFKHHVHLELDLNAAAAGFDGDFCLQGCRRFCGHSQGRESLAGDGKAAARIIGRQRAIGVHASEFVEELGIHIAKESDGNELRLILDSSNPTGQAKLANVHKVAFELLRCGE